MLGAAIFGRDMLQLYEIPHLADWTNIGNRRQNLVDCDCAKGNLRRVDFDYFQGQKVLLKKDGILRKAETKNEGLYVIIQVHTNYIVRIQRGSVSERLNIRRLSPYSKSQLKTRVVVLNVRQNITCYLYSSPFQSRINILASLL